MPSDRLRLGELMAALSLATDLGMGQPLEHTLRTCLLAQLVAERLGVSEEVRADIYYVALLRFLGCTASASDSARMAGGDEIALRAAIAPVMGGPTREFVSHVMPTVGSGASPVRRARLVAGMMRNGPRRLREGIIAHCEAGDMLADRLELAPGVRSGLAHSFERWDGSGMPNGLAADAIDLGARVLFVARDVEVLSRGDSDEWRAAVRRRAGRAYDPEVAHAFESDGRTMLGQIAAQEPWDAVLACEPGPRPSVSESRLDVVLEAFADFVDMKSPYLAGHSRAVSALAADAAAHAGIAGGADHLRRAGLVHDLGRASVPSGIWDKPGPLTTGEWERVRLHSYYTERVLARAPALAALAPTAGAHHERLDGSGYHRGLRGDTMDVPSCVLAAADVYVAMTQARPYRAAIPATTVAAEMRSSVATERLQKDAVEAVLVAAGHRRNSVTREWPSGLTDREVEVLRLICRGGTNKAVAHSLSISAATVDHHIRHIYDKADVRTRAGATLFALQNGLLQPS